MTVFLAWRAATMGVIVRASLVYGSGWLPFVWIPTAESNQNNDLSEGRCPVKTKNRGVSHGLPAQALEQNAILRGLDESVASQILEKGRLAHLAVQERIYEPEKPIRQVFFPLD